jgi:hypothetical protein
MTRTQPPNPATPPKPKRSKVKRTAVPHDPNVGYITRNGQGATIEAFDYLVGNTTEYIDKERYALRPGKRISRKYRDPKTGKWKGGNVYYELRANRADLDADKRL